MTAETWEPIDYLAEFREREKSCVDMVDFLTQRAASDSGRIWAHHLSQMLAQLEFFRGLLQEEIDQFGQFRYHGFQPDEVLDFIDEDLDRLAAWLCRMAGAKIPNDAGQ